MTDSAVGVEIVFDEGRQAWGANVLIAEPGSQLRLTRGWFKTLDELDKAVREDIDESIHPRVDTKTLLAKWSKHVERARR